MSQILILMILSVPGDDTKKALDEYERARRAAVVDAIMAGPSNPRLRVNQTLTTELIQVVVDASEGSEDDEDDVMKAPVRVDYITVLESSNFDRWVFGNLQEDRMRRAWLEERLRLKCEQLAKEKSLSPAEVEKLRLAGRGDIKRLFDRVEGLRPGFEGLRANVESARKFLLRDVQPVASQFHAGPFGDDSLLAKTLRKIRSES